MTNSAAQNKKPYYKISSLEKGMQVIELLADKGTLSVTDVARSLDQNRSASHRFLATLKEMGYVIQDDRSRYRLSLKLFEMGNKIANITEIRSVVRPYMRQLSNRHGETVNLGRIEGDTVVTIDVVLGTEVIRFDAHIGQRSPVHTLAMGKAILAFRTEEEQRQYLDNAEFNVVTEKTIRNRKAFEKELQKVRKQGFAIDDEEWAIGLKCVSAPIINHSPYPSYAISISGPSQRMTAKKLDIIRKDLVKMCREIGAKLSTF